MSIQYYATPNTTFEALGELAKMNGDGMIIAGGTDLIPRLKQKQIDAQALIDVTGIAEIKCLKFQADELIIGAAATHSQVCQDRQVQKIWPALTDACGCIGSPQIRNIATLTGNVVNAQPAADAAVALVALDARMEWASPKGSASEPIEDLYAGIGQSKINCSRDLVTAIKVPKPGGAFGNAYGRISPRNSFCMPTVNGAAALTCERNKITSARLVMGPVAEKPFRSLKAEAVLRGSDIGDPNTLEKAALLASQEANPRNSCLRGCSDYRKELLRVLVRRVLEKAVARARAYND